MKSEDLDSYLRTDVLGECFELSLREEVNAYIQSTLSSKSSILISGDFSPDWNFTRGVLISLLTKYLNGELLEWDLEYVVSVLEMHCESEDEKMDEILFNFSDAYLGYSINESNVRQAISFLLDQSSQLEMSAESSDKLREGYRSVFQATTK